MAEQKNWKFEIGQRVALGQSVEEGIVVGRAEYSNSCDNFYVRYVTGAGCQTETWFAADALDDAESADSDDLN